MKNLRHSNLVLSAVIIAALLGGVSGRAEEIQLKLLSEGAMPKLGGYMPQKLELSETKPKGITKAPAGLSAPLYGELKLGPSESPATFYIIVDEPEGQPSRLFVDANANGDLTDDAAAEWKARTNKTAAGQEMTMYSGGSKVTVNYGSEKTLLHIAMYRFDKHDTNRAALAKTLLYYGDYARTGEVKLGDKTYAALLSDPLTTGDFRGSKEGKIQPRLLLDLNNDGKFNSSHESFSAGKAFNIGGVTYEISGVSASGASFALEKSSATVEETKPMASLHTGSPALAFAMKSTDGTEISFPSSYKGKVVMLDFWATWCGPCMAEMPNVTAAYDKYHPQGFEILGISLDQENAEKKLAAITKEKNMPWPQIYDGKFWAAQVAKQYYIESIPQAFIVDGDTGLILAEGEEIRGGKLAPAIEKALAAKTAKAMN